MARRKGLTAEAYGYFMGVVENDIKLTTTSIAGADEESDVTADVDYLETLMAHRAILKRIAPPELADKGKRGDKRRKTPTAPRRKKKEQGEAAAGEPRPHVPAPLAAAPEEERPPAPRVQAGDQEATMLRRIESTVTQIQMSDEQFAAEIDSVTEGKFKCLADLQSAPYIVLQAIHRSLLSYMRT